LFFLFPVFIVFYIEGAIAVVLRGEILDCRLAHHEWRGLVGTEGFMKSIFFSGFFNFAD